MIFKPEKAIVPNIIPMVKTVLFVLSVFLANPLQLIAQDETAPPSTFFCAECDHLVGDAPLDGKQRNVQPGDVICLVGGRKYDKVTFSNIIGTPDNPVIIRNCGGGAKIDSQGGFGMKFQHSQYFKLMGNGGPEQYGICISTQKGFYLSLELFTSDFEISGVEIAGPEPGDSTRNAGFAGIGVKTSPYQDCDLFTDPTRQAWVMRNISIHHNYIHHTGGEGMYIGHGFYKGREEDKCPGQMLYSHSIKGVRVYENLIENVGFDGIQIKNADEDVKVYNNVIRNYGTRNEAVHNEGLFIGEGTTGEFYGNIVDSGSGNGCQIQGLGNLYIHDNLFNRSGENGIYAADGPFVVRLPDGYFNISNNTITNSAQAGFVFYNNNGGPKRFSGNLVVGATILMKKGATVELSDNIFSNEQIYAGHVPVPILRVGPVGINGEPALKKLSEYQFYTMGEY